MLKIPIQTTTSVFTFAEDILLLNLKTAISTVSYAFSFVYQGKESLFKEP